jgi:UDP-N-acetylglucosamine 2-epimerase (non-hydrolysing)
MNLALILLSTLIATTPAFAVPYEFDSAHTDVAFSVKHLMVSNTKGNFGDVKGAFDLDESKKLILVTGHRRENFGDGVLNICEALLEISQSAEVEIVYPVHLNPNIKGPVHDLLANVPNIHLVEPLDYEAFVWMMDKAYLVITDSGGVQEEAPSLGKPVLVMRDKTERPEAVEAGTVILVGTDRQKIVSETLDLISNRDRYTGMSMLHNPYGDGKAVGRIAQFLKENL